MKNTLWIVEDTSDLAGTFLLAAEAAGLKAKVFGDCSLLGTAVGNPTHLLIDVGAVGSMLINETKHYTSVLLAVRDRFPGAEIYLRSGIDTNAFDLVEEMNDPMIKAVPIKKSIQLIEQLARS